MSGTTLQYLEKAMHQLRDLGLMPETVEEAPVLTLLNRIADIDEEKSVAIARTLSQASVFNDVVREQVSLMTIGERYEEITEAFNSIRDDAKSMVQQVEDGKIDTFERLGNVWMKVTRGDIATNAYQDFRGAIKESEIYALEILQKAEALWNEAQGKLKQASETVSNFTGDDLAERAKLELVRDEKMRELQFAEDRYQISKDLSDNLTVSYNTSEVIMARLMQTTSAKDRVYKQAITFFGTNETVLTALSASFTGLFGLHESTRTLEAMKEGVSRSLEDLADIGGKVQEAAVKAGYGPTIRADAVKKLVDSVVNFQARTTEIIAEMRKLSTQNAQEIRDAVEDGKQRLAAIVNRGDSLPLPHKF